METFVGTPGPRSFSVVTFALLGYGQRACGPLCFVVCSAGNMEKYKYLCGLEKWSIKAPTFLLGKSTF
jgi:hypothetical protein